jgi:hypothetical protein
MEDLVQEQGRCRNGGVSFLQENMNPPGENSRAGFYFTQGVVEWGVGQLSKAANPSPQDSSHLNRTIAALANPFS